MKRRRLWHISVATTAEATDAVTEMLGTMFARPVSSCLDVKTGVSVVTVYCQPKSAGLAGQREKIRAGLERIRQCGLNPGSDKIRIAEVRREDWAESWKRHFKPIEIGGALLVKSSWSKRGARKKQAVVVLDPGLSFGTSQHPTTAFCLSELVKRRVHGQPQSFLDLGTGSGILAIAAAKLGYAPVCALDSDPAAVRVARANARANHVHQKLKIIRGDATKLPVPGGRRYDLVCANLFSGLLIAERRRIAGQLHRGGTLVLAGILQPEFSRVQKTFGALGLKLVSWRTAGGWRSGSFSFTRENFLKKFE